MVVTGIGVTQPDTGLTHHVTDRGTTVELPADSITVIEVAFSEDMDPDTIVADSPHASFRVQDARRRNVTGTIEHVSPAAARLVLEARVLRAATTYTVTLYGEADPSDPDRPVIRSQQGAALEGGNFVFHIRMT